MKEIRKVITLLSISFFFFGNLSLPPVFASHGFSKETQCSIKDPLFKQLYTIVSTREWDQLKLDCTKEELIAAMGKSPTRSSKKDHLEYLYFFRNVNNIRVVDFFIFKKNHLIIFGELGRQFKHISRPMIEQTFGKADDQSSMLTQKSYTYLGENNAPFQFTWDLGKEMNGFSVGEVTKKMSRHMMWDMIKAGFIP